MTETMPSFSRVEHTLAVMEPFYLRAADICEANARRACGPRDRAFLYYAAKQARSLAAALHHHWHTRSDATLSTWLQSTPDEHLPGAVELWQLQSHGSDAAETLRILHEASAAWARLHLQLARLARTSAGNEMHVNVATLLDIWCRKLSIAHFQLDDM